MPDTKQLYTSNTHYITLGNITNKFTQDVSQFSNQRLAKAIKLLMKKGMSKTDIATELGITRQSIYDILEADNAKK